MVSVIIPCYNAEKYIENCLDSILNQTDRDIELILVNDGSTDCSDSIIQKKENELNSKLSRFIYLKQKNKGVGAACNLGFKYVTGEFLLLLDSDDLLMPRSIQLQREWLQTHIDFDIVRTNGYYVEERTNKIINSFESGYDKERHKTLFEEIFEGTTFLWPGTYMIRMELLNKIYPKREIYPSRSGQNLQFLWMASYYGKDGFINEKLMKYFIREESLSHFTYGNKLQKEINAMLGYKGIRKYLIEHVLPDNEKNYWNQRLELLYAKVFMRLGIKHNNKKLIKENYSLAKKLNKEEKDWNLSIEYYKVINPMIHYILRLFRKMKIIGV